MSDSRTPADPRLRDRIRGCLLGGAIGDALGAPVEFLSLAQIRTAFGADGIRELAPAYGRIGAITDDTQLTLFTAEGVIRADQRQRGKGICHAPSVIHHALLRWLYTQGERAPALLGEPDGWLVERRELFARRAPGLTCLSALRTAERRGNTAQNESKGCGALMRIAPIGLFAPRALERTFEIACESAQSTHGHPSSTFASGAFALVIAELVGGASLARALASAKEPLFREPTATEVLAAVERAEAVAASSAPTAAETVESLGAGWVAEEALAIALFCALRAESFEHGVRLAVNHGGDSDSTGSLTGQVLGTLLGVDAIAERWREQVELGDVVEKIAEDLAVAIEGGMLQRDYPGW